MASSLLVQCIIGTPMTGTILLLGYICWTRPYMSILQACRYVLVIGALILFFLSRIFVDPADREISYTANSLLLKNAVALQSLLLVGGNCFRICSDVDLQQSYPMPALESWEPIWAWRVLIFMVELISIQAGDFL